MSIFLQATRSGWYPQFLKPVVTQILEHPGTTEVLDIGTGPGTLPQMITQQNPTIQVTGIDTSRAMIDEARKSIQHENVSFADQQENKPLPFSASQVDIISFCSVLFLLNGAAMNQLLDEALRILKPGGKLVILTPSGRKPIITSFTEVWRYPFSIRNYTFVIWKLATTAGGRRWSNKNWLEKFASENGLKYTKSLVFNSNATLETITQ
jgi:ubiquinone/menaquinone biosynthesis C-methylase UbiE